jgi:hypothetical protein
MLCLATRSEHAEERWSRAHAHAEFPIERTVRSKDATAHAQLLRTAARRIGGNEDVLYVAGDRNIRILGRSEDVLGPAVGRLTRHHAGRITVGPLHVRYVHAVQTLEPWMKVLINVEECYAGAIEEDFEDRRGTIERLLYHGTMCILGGEAPLALLQGYAEWLRNLTDAESSCRTWLARYRPVEVGPRAA